MIYIETVKLEEKDLDWSWFQATLMPTGFVDDSLNDGIVISKSKIKEQIEKLINEAYQKGKEDWRNSLHGYIPYETTGLHDQYNNHGRVIPIIPPVKGQPYCSRT